MTQTNNNSRKEKEDWMNRKWRPAMAWLYLTVCVTDFIIFPILWSILQATYKGSVTEAWVPLTLQGAGLFHLAMGAVLGISAWSRGKEKIAGVNSYSQYNQGLRTPTYYVPKRIPSQPEQEI